MKESKPDEFVEQFIQTVLTYRKAIGFARKHKVWQGFWNYGWVSRALIILAMIAGLKFFQIYIHWISQASVKSPIGALQSMGTLVSDLAVGGYHLFFAGSMKYVIIILMEVIIFHASRRTIKILTEKEGETDFNAFLKAQIRMLKVVIRTWILEMILTLILKVAVGIVDPLAFLEYPLSIAIQSYCLGLVVMDNYFEQFGLSIKESFQYARNYRGVALGVGAVLNAIMLVPLIGSFVGPFLAAITATLVLYKISDIHIMHREEIDGVEEMV